MVFVVLNSICACCFLLGWDVGLCFRVCLFVLVVSDFWWLLFCLCGCFAVAV